MKKYLLSIVALMLILIACKQQKENATSEEEKTLKEATITEAPPGILSWKCDWAEGTFERWTFKEFYLPEDDNFENIKTTIAVDIASVLHEDKGLEKHLRQDDYLDATAHPTAVILIDGAEAQADGSFQTTATMTLRGETQTFPLTFNVMKTMPYKIKGTANFSRSDFKVGDDEGVDEAVTISFSAVAPNNKE